MVFPLTDFLNRFHPGGRLRLNGDWATVAEASWHKNQILLKLVGVDHISDAEKLKGAFLEVPANEKPELEEDEFLTEDLIGLEAVAPDGTLIGRVDDVKESPAHDLLIIGKIMVPAVKHFVKKVDLKSRKIVLELIPGMEGEEE